jgi:predicted regulator of Ras-like GTPase activity (Roadblock/LC7/MglB family)
MTTSDTHLQWLLTNLRDRAAQIEAVIALTADGLLRAAAPAPGGPDGAARIEDHERLAAAMSAVAGTAQVVADQFGGHTKQTIIETDEGYCLIIAAGRNAYLAVYATREADLGLVAFEANKIVGTVGDELAAANRVPDLSPTPAVSSAQG